MDIGSDNPQLNPKKLEEYEKERISYKSAHHVRHGEAEAKRRTSGYKRTRIKAIIHKALIDDDLEELSIPLLKSALIPLKNYYKPEAHTLKTIVECKLKRRIETHGARKRRQEEETTRLKLYVDVLPEEASERTASVGISSHLEIDRIDIDVVWDSPTIADFFRFCALMEARKKKTIYIHTVMNMRVSVFIYLYRYLILGTSQKEAHALMMTIWQPDDTWQKFIETVITQYQK
jgi:hypothetical protein